MQNLLQWSASIQVIVLINPTIDFNEYVDFVKMYIVRTIIISNHCFYLIINMLLIFVKTNFGTLLSFVDC